jgi:hypothetical protein
LTDSYAGYRFDGWISSSGSFKSAKSLTTTFTMQDGEATITPVFSRLGKDSSAVAITGQIYSYNPQRAATVSLYEAETDIEVASMTLAVAKGFRQAVQEFRLNGIKAGIYDLKVTKQTHLSYTLTGVVVGLGDLNLTENADSAINMITLPCGDINGDGLINDGDLTELWKLSNYNRSIKDDGVNEMCDLNGDGMINDADLTILWLISNYNKGSTVITS